MTTADEDRWSDNSGVEDYHLPFSVPQLDESTRAEAVAAVEAALANYTPPSAYQRLRDSLWLFGYMVRLRLGTVFTKLYCRISGKDPRLVSATVWLKLGI